MINDERCFERKWDRTDDNCTKLEEKTLLGD